MSTDYSYDQLFGNESDAQNVSSTNFTTEYEFEHGLVDFCMFSYVYFIPRLIAFRCITIGEEKQKPHFWTMTHLMLFVILLSAANICRCFNYVSEPTEASVRFWNYCCLAAEQCISPMVFFISTQQYAEIESFYFSHLFLETLFQYIFIYVLFFVNLVLNFWKFINDSETELQVSYVHDVGIPLVTFLFYNSIRSRVRQERKYAQNNGQDDGKPSIIDRVGKIAWYQGLMAIATLISIAIYDKYAEDSYIQTIVKFILFTKTPILSCVAYLSILRKNRPTRPCFLLCCTEEDIVRALPATRVGQSS